jgi:hypothetical protein
VTTFGALFLLAAGLLVIVKRREVLWVQKAVFGARLPMGCAVAEGVALLAMAIGVAVLGWMGW